MDGPPGSGRWEHETAAGRHDHELRARVVTWPPLRLARLRCERGSVDVVLARWLPKKRWRSHGDHRHGYSSLVRASGVLAGRAGQAGATGRSRSRPPHQVGKSLSVEDEVVIEATGNSAAVERILRPFVKRVVVANPRMVRAIAYARVKTDKIDAVILARLHAGGFLPEVWVADDNTQRQRRQTVERMGVLEQVVRTKGRIHAILHANLIPKYSGHLFGKAGKKWLAGLPLPEEEKAIVGRLVDELERNSDQLAKLDMTIIGEALENPRVFA